MACIGRANGTNCGINAFCNIEDCVCTDGFFRTEDFGGQKLVNDCIGNDIAFYVLYSLYCFIIAFSVAWYLSRIERKSQLKRLSFYMIGMGSCLAVGVLKLIDVQRAFSIDPVITIIHAVALPNGFYSNYITQQKYLKLQFRLVPIMHKTYEKQLRRRERILLAASIISILGSLIYACSIFFTEEDELQIRIIILRIGFGILAVCAFTFTYALMVIGNGFEKALKITPKTDVIISDIITRASEVKMYGAMSLLIVGVVYMSCVVNEYGLFFGTYTIPVQLMNMFFATVLVLRANIRKIDGRPNPRYAKTPSRKGTKTTVLNSSFIKESATEKLL